MAERMGVGVFGERPDFIERRLEGVTFADALADYGSRGKIDVSQIPQGDERHRFEEIKISQVSEDHHHALAYGFDMGRTTLLRDGEPILSVEGDRPIVHATNADFSRVIAINSGRRRDVYLISSGEVKQIMPGFDVNVVGHSADLDWVLCSHYYPGGKKTEFYVFRDSEGRKSSNGVFEVGGDFSKPKLIGANPDISRVIWQGKKTGFWGEETSDTYVFANDGFLAKAGSVQAFASPDASKTLIVLENGHTRWSLETRVLVNGAEVFGRKGLRRTGSAKITQDLSVAALELADFRWENRRLLVIKSGQEPRLSDKYDSLSSLEEEDGGLKAVVTRGKVKYEVRIPVH